MNGVAGYARVSTRDQAESLEAQKLALLGVGAQRVFADVISGAKSGRPGLREALGWLREGDMLVVTRLDRLGRSTVDTLRTVAQLEAAGVRLKALDPQLDTGTPAGRLVVRTIASLAEWEREVIVERTREGLAHARRRGRVGGRPRVLSPAAVDAVKAALEAGLSVAEVAALHGVSRRTITRVRAGDYH
ncbi:recombinase family protein [Micrococcus luteus]|uniref:recombinase family protein n=1 Tax=Micrococcus luteus TaxID=1270 RepID=UPI00254F8C83|nr:recombinase family protein [Micrococcus luteus]MDK8178422.1 recombinase family protein [Micrococcus luteus]